MPAPAPVAPTAPPLWHQLDAAQACAALGACAQTGLSPAQVAEQRARYGSNNLPEAARSSAWRRLLRQFDNPLIYVLLLAGVVTVLLGSLVDAAVIFGVVLINALIGHIQEGKAERALQAVRDMLAAQATVLRAGLAQQIAASALVPGDVLLLQSGDKVPADVRLLSVKNLRTIEAALTGEAMPVEKTEQALEPATVLAERRNMAYSGTLVASGQARALVVATGVNSEMGRIGSLVEQVSSLGTPLTQRLDQFARRITGFILLLSLLTLLYGYLVVQMPLLELFLAVVGLAVAAIPEGMPAVVTIVLAMSTRAMAQQQAVVRRLPAVETLGSVSVICSDKTGTLTHNAMTVVRVLLADGDVRVSGQGYSPEGQVADCPTPEARADLQALAQCAVLCNDAQLRRAPQGWTLTGDPTEGALLALGLKLGWTQEALSSSQPRLDGLPFESEQQFMATLHRQPDGRAQLYLKGAPERVLALCRCQAGGLRLDADYWQAALARTAQAGERVLALARSPWPQADRAGQALTLADITPCFELIGMVGIMDPLREEARQAVAQCQRAGIRVKMITGDHAATASAIGASLGLDTAQVLTGAMIDAMDDALLRHQVGASDVFARASPEHKLRLVAALQAQGSLVAMTGDGVNDAPALKAADIGVAMGCKGTDAAREAADLVLTDDNFATIAAAVRQGRVAYDNIKKSLMHMLPTNGGEAGVIVLAIFSGMPLPVTAGQILWANTVTAVTLALALAFEPAEPGVMQAPPRPAQEEIITRALALRTLMVIALMVAATFSIFRWELGRGASLELARTAALNTIVFCGLFYLYNVRQFTGSALSWRALRGNPVVLWVSVILLGLQLLFTYAPVMQRWFGSVALGGSSWLAISAAGLGVFLCVEAEKWLLRRRQWRRIGGSELEKQGAP